MKSKPVNVSVLIFHFVSTNSNVSTSNSNEVHMDCKAFVLMEIIQEEGETAQAREKRRRPGEGLGNQHPGGGVGL